MKKTNLFFFLLFVTSILITWSACQSLEEVEMADLQQSGAEFAVPLFNSRVAFREILNNFDDNTSITIEPDGLIRLNYQGDVLNVSSQDLFDALITLVPPIQVVDTNFVTDFDIPGSIDIDYMDFKRGNLYLSFKNKHPQAVTVDFYINEILENGVPFHATKTIPASDGENHPQEFIATDLNGWRWDALDDQFTIRYEAIKADGTRDTLDEVYLTLLNLEYSYTEGYLGNDLYEIGVDTIEIDFFENWTRGDVYFEDPTINLRAFNSFGFPLDGEFEYFLVQTVEGQSIPLVSEFITNGVYIDYPRLDQVGETVMTNFSFTKENSNIDEVLGSGPVAIEYRLDGEPNPNMDTNIRGFMLDTSQLRVQLEAELPIYGAASNFSVRDTFEVNMDDVQDVLTATFKIVSENHTPLSIDMQLYFLDTNQQVLDSLLIDNQRLIEAASVDASGNVTAPAEHTEFVPLSAERLDHIRQATDIVLQNTFSTTNDGTESVRILADQELSVRMGAIFTLK